MGDGYIRPPSGPLWVRSLVVPGLRKTAAHVCSAPPKRRPAGAGPSCTFTTLRGGQERCL